MRRSAPSGTRATERGAALLLVLFVLVIAWTATLLVSVALAVDLRTARSDQRRLQLTTLCDSALAEALAELDRDRYATGIGWHEYGKGEIASRIGDVNGAQRTVRASARVGGVERTIVATVVLFPSGPQVHGWRPLAVVPVGESEIP